MSKGEEKDFVRLEEEIHLEGFAGGGGASVGYYMVSRRNPNAAINHSPPAVWMHRANHPFTQHYCEEIFSVDLLELVRKLGYRRVGSWWVSPDCKHFSKAKGGALIDKRIRALAWFICKVVGIGGGRRSEGGRGPVCPRVLYLENVEEFLTWGPLVAKRCRKTGRVVKTDGSVAARGEYVPLREQWLVPDLKRSGKYFRKLLEEMRGRGATSIDWRISRASSYGTPTIRKRLLLIIRFDGQPIVWPEPTHGSGKGQLAPRGSYECIDFSDLGHSIIHLSKEQGKRLGIQRPLVAASNRRCARGVERFVMKSASPFIVSLTHHGGDRLQSVFEPLNTITAAHRGEKAVVFPLVTHAQHGGASRPVTEPLHTVAASPKDQNQVVMVHVARQFGTAVGHAAEEPLRAVMAGGGGGKNLLVATFLAQNNGGENGHQSYGHAAESPFSTITARGTNQSLVACYLVKYYGTEQAPEIDKPLHTITTKDRFGVGFADLGIPPLTEELAAKARVTAEWLRQNGVAVEGEFAMCGELIIYDIAMRMFKPRELFLAQGFPPDYIIDYGINDEGEKVLLTKTQQIQMCGNSVCPPWAAAHIAANNPEMVRWDVRKEIAA